MQETLWESSTQHVISDALEHWVSSANMAPSTSVTHSAHLAAEATAKEAIDG